MIRAERLSYRGEGRGQGDRPRLAEVSLSVGRGELCLVTGPSGAGKSTLLHLLGGLLRPTAGTVSIDGRPVSRFSALHRDLARRSIGLLPQKLHLVEWLEVRGNLELPLVARGAQGSTSTVDVMRRLGLEELAARRVAQLSGGERQRVALARALAGRPPVLLLDEPTAHQDDAHAATMLDAVGERLGAGAALVVAAHDGRVADWARALAAAAWHGELREGRLVRLERLA